MKFSRQRDGVSFPLYDNGLIFAMNFDNVSALGEVASSVVRDVSPYNESTWTSYSPAWTANGKRGGAYYFNGSYQYIATHDANRFTLSNNYTISVWIKPLDTSNREKYIMGTYDGSNGFFLLLTNSDTNYLYFRAGGTAMSSPYEIKEDGTRKHVTFTRSGSVGTFYVDGIARTVGSI